MPDREPLLDRVRRQLAGEEAPPVTRPGDPPLVTRCNWCSPDGTPDAAHHPGGQVEHVTGDPLLVAGQPGLVTRPHDWTKGASMDEGITVVVGTEDGKEEAQDLEAHLREWHRLPLDHSWDDEHLQRVHEQDHKEGGTFDYHAHPIDA